MSYLRYLCVFVYSDIQHILCCILKKKNSVCLRIVYSMLPDSLDYAFFDFPFGIL